MKHLMIITLILLTFSSCKKDEHDGFDGILLDKWDGQPVSNVTIHLQETECSGNLMGSCWYETIDSLKSESNGTFHIEAEFDNNYAEISDPLYAPRRHNGSLTTAEPLYLHPYADEFIDWEIQPKTWIRVTPLDVGEQNPDRLTIYCSSDDLLSITRFIYEDKTIVLDLGTDIPESTIKFRYKLAQGENEIIQVVDFNLIKHDTIDYVLEY